MATLLGILTVLLFPLTMIPGWITHFVCTIGLLLEEGNTGIELGVFALGTFVPPIGVIHGWLIWFGNGLAL